MLIDYMLNKSDNLNSIDILSNLNKFMYSKQGKKLLHKQPNIFELKPKINEVINVNDTKKNINCYRPTQINSLFWCVFIAVHGYEEYIKVNHNYGAKELEIKQEISTALKIILFSVTSISYFIEVESEVISSIFNLLIFPVIVKVLLAFSEVKV